MITDIIVCTKNRLPLLKRTLEYLFERTTSEFRLHVIDDASTEGNVPYLQSLLEVGMIAGLVLRSKSEPIGANWNAAAKLAQSDILVFTDDDILCPQLDPDWLSRGLAAMAGYRKMGLIALEDPSAVHAVKALGVAGPLTMCDRYGAHLAFIRRDLMRSIVIPPVGGTLENITICSDSKRLDRAWSRAVWSRGYSVAYLTGVYCQHIGDRSARNGDDLSSRSVVADPTTLHPILAGGHLTRTLNLGAGNSPLPGAVNHDIIKHRSEIDVAWDLNNLPWPWPDNSFDLVYASSVLEHLELTLLESCNEIWRILLPGGRLWVKLPYWKADSAYNDPTHRWPCGVCILDAFDPNTRAGTAYNFYTPRKWKIIQKLRVIKSGKALIGTMEVIK